MATIEIDKVTKVYGNGFRAVDDVSLTIGDGEFVVWSALRAAASRRSFGCSRASRR